MSYLDLELIDFSDGGFYVRNLDNHDTVLQYAQGYSPFMSSIYDTDNDLPDDSLKDTIFVPYGQFSAAICCLKPSEEAQVHLSNAFKCFQQDDIEKSYQHLWAGLTKYYIQDLGSLPQTVIDLAIEVVSRLLIADFKRNISKHLSFPALSEMIFKFLLRQETEMSELIKYVNTLMGIATAEDTFELASKHLFFENQKVTCYYPATIGDFILLDIFMFLNNSDLTVKKCECCERFFIPTRINDKYCRTKWLKTGKPCFEFMKAHPQNPFSMELQKARDKQYKNLSYYKSKNWITDDELMSLKNNWSAESKKQRIHYEIANDIEGFKKWLAETRFTKDKILNNKYELIFVTSC